jgi:hypothetical protein
MATSVAVDTTTAVTPITMNPVVLHLTFFFTNFLGRGVTGAVDFSALPASATLSEVEAEGAGVWIGTEVSARACRCANMRELRSNYKFNFLVLTNPPVDGAVRSRSAVSHV